MDILKKQRRDVYKMNNHFDYEDDLVSLIDNTSFFKGTCKICNEDKVINGNSVCFNCHRFKMHLMK